MNSRNEQALLTVFKNILEGPEYLESHFGRMIVGPESSGSDEKSRYQLYLSLLKDLGTISEIKNHPVYDFCTGYFLQQAASMNDDDNSIRKEILNSALVAYSQFISKGKGNRTILYFAQWQCGVIKDQLQYPWPEVEETLLQSCNIFRERGEAMLHVIQHYRGNKEFGLGYICSSIAKNQYYKNLPPTAAWQVNKPFYLWKVLNYHLSLCSHLGMEEEAAETHKELWNCYDLHPEYFSEPQVQQLFQNQKVYSHE